MVYGGGEGGLAYFLKSVNTRLQKDPRAELSTVEQAYVDRVLADAWRAAQAKYGAATSTWNRQARQRVTQRPLGYFESLDGFPTLDRERDLKFPGLTVVDGGTIRCQTAQSYTQWVPLHQPDDALSLLPIGQSERPGSQYHACNRLDWERGSLHPAPISREALETIAETRQRLRPIQP
jgi:acyl-homoserine lactone acylase PvdQ